MPCPHFEVSIVKRSDDKSAVASAAYQSGMNLFSEYQQKWKRYADKPGVLHAEIMLPENAPDAYISIRRNIWQRKNRRSPSPQFLTAGCKQKTFLQT